MKSRSVVSGFHAGCSWEEVCAHAETITMLVMRSCMCSVKGLPILPAISELATPCCRGSNTTHTGKPDRRWRSGASHPRNKIMITKNDLLDVLHKECDICLHLYGKLPKGALEYRLAPGSRSTIELLRYLTHAGASGTHAMIEGNWDAFTAAVKRTSTMPAEEFPSAMAAQKQELAKLFAGISNAQFDEQTAKLPTGETMKLGQSLLMAPVRWMSAYRMQLFLHAKAAGNDALWTPDNWAGKDMPRPVKS